MQQHTETYRERSTAFLTKAHEELAAGDLEQASEKAWGAAALMVKAAAENRHIRHENHNDLWKVVNALIEETGDDEMSDLFSIASALHINFYENTMSARAIRRSIQRVEAFAGKMGRYI